MSASETIENPIPVGLQMIASGINDLTELSMIKRWRREYEAYQRRKKRRHAVLAAVTEGYDVVSEIAAHTGIPSASVRRILIELVGKNRVRSAKTKNYNHRIELRFEIA